MTETDLQTRLLPYGETIALEVFGKPFRVDPRRGLMYFGSKGATKFNLRTGLWYDFSEQIGGNLFQAFVLRGGLSKRDAAARCLELIGENPTGRVWDGVTRAAREASPQPWKPVIPAPATAGRPDIFKEPGLRFILEKYRVRERYPYFDADGRLLLMTVRLEDRETGAKEVMPLTWCRHDDGREGWRWRGLAGWDKRPLFGLQPLARRRHAPVLVVEGEKTCRAAYKLFPDFVAVTWMGGCSAVDKTDWSPLAGRRGLLWSDADRKNPKTGIHAGQAAMATLAGILHDLGGAFHAVAIPADDDALKEMGLPDGWDLADAFPEGWSQRTLTDMVDAAGPPQEPTALHAAFRLSCGPG
jgi:hypothetical protein